MRLGVVTWLPSLGAVLEDLAATAERGQGIGHAVAGIRVVRRYRDRPFIVTVRRLVPAATGTAAGPVLGKGGGHQGRVRSRWLKAAMAIVGQFSRCQFVAQIGIGGGEPGVQADRR